MIDFSKTGTVRIDQLRDEINAAASQLGFVLPSQTIQWILELEVIRFTNATAGVDAQIDVEALALQYQTQVQNIINNHVPSNVYFGHEIKDQNIQDVIDRLNLNELASKSPLEIYQIVQARIDGWSNLTQAKADMREYFPLLFAAVYWLAKGD